MEQQVFLSDNNNSFWTTSNKLGLIRPETLSLTELNASYKRYLGELSDLNIGVSAFYDYGANGSYRLGINEAFVSVAWWVIETSLGPRARAEMHQGLSAVNGDILWSNNSRPPPGLEIRTRNPMKPWRWIGMEGALAHYWLGKEREIQNALIHYKYLGLFFSPTDASVFKASLHHYAQWGGILPDNTPQPKSFQDFILVFFGKTNNPASSINQTGALGNHIGSYHLLYQYFMNSGHLEWYYQAVFEGAAGKDSGNYPDGLYGMYWEPGEGSLLKGMLLEYIQTTWQGGVNVNDNYFNHGVYMSGWTYRTIPIGLPFFEFDKSLPGFTNNRVEAIHLGARAKIKDVDYKLMMSYVKNYGARSETSIQKENILYSGLEMNFKLKRFIDMGVNLGGDFSDINGPNLSVGLSLKYNYLLNFRY